MMSYDDIHMLFSTIPSIFLNTLRLLELLGDVLKPPVFHKQCFYRLHLLPSFTYSIYALHLLHYSSQALNVNIKDLIPPTLLSLSNNISTLLNSLTGL